MPITVVIPGPLRELAGNREQVELGGVARSLADALALLWRECPAIRDRVMTERGEVRPHVNIFVDGEDMRHAGGFETPVRDGSEIVLMAAVSGGDLGTGNPAPRAAFPATHCFTSARFPRN